MLYLKFGEKRIKVHRGQAKSTKLVYVQADLDNCSVRVTLYKHPTIMQSFLVCYATLTQKVHYKVLTLQFPIMYKVAIKEKLVIQAPNLTDV